MSLDLRGQRGTGRRGRRRIERISDASDERANQLDPRLVLQYQPQGRGSVITKFCAQLVRLDAQSIIILSSCMRDIKSSPNSQPYYQCMKSTRLRSTIYTLCANVCSTKHQSIQDTHLKIRALRTDNVSSMVACLYGTPAEGASFDNTKLESVTCNHRERVKGIMHILCEKEDEPCARLLRKVKEKHPCEKCQAEESESEEAE